ncbi:DUF4326 domain-containing protein [Nonomuraea sp. GTA35]|uniref:DUF4326 domain-containing protein n=1 Tax=Nonomuraea sp. GTA35 TaxID=1676746 RepID=UPI0035BFF7A6
MWFPAVRVMDSRCLGRVVTVADREPQRIQRRRTKGYRLPEGAVCVDRSTRWGNPFKVGALVMEPGSYASPACPYDGFMEPGTYQWTGLGGPYTYEIRRVRDAADAAALFRPYVAFHDDVYPPEEIRRDLGGRDLACWCKVGTPCHGDERIRLANGGTDA